MKTKSIQVMNLARNFFLCLVVVLSTVVVSADNTSPLCFKAKNGYVSVRFDIKNVTHTIQYSIDSINWIVYTSNTSVLLTDNQKVYFRAASNQTVATAFGDSDTLNCSRFYFSSSNGGVVEGSGNIMSLYGYSCPDLPLQNRAFSWMFYNCSILTTAPELRATTLDTCCYDDMFKGCISLAEAPELPAMALAKDCYCYMFYGCTSLTTPPELPATTLVDGCYHDMFKYCSGLTKTPVLPATNLDIHCYERMFYYCSSLTSLPELPATTLPSCCYYRMFWGSSSLVVNTSGPGQSWRINASSAAADAVSGMFNGTSGSMNSTPSINTTYYVASAQYTVTVDVNDVNMGTVSGSGQYAYGSTATLVATPAPNHHFVNWSNGNASPIISIQVSSDTTLIANFAQDIITYNVTVNANDNSMGSVTGGGVYISGTTAALNATPTANHHFVRWSNGNLTATTAIVVTSDTTLTAIFAKDDITYNVNVTANDPTMGSVNGGGTYYGGTTATITAIPEPYHHFVMWSNGDLTATTTIVVTSDTTLTATFAPNGITYNVTVNANDNSMGSVTGSGIYNSGSIATLTATPIENHHFVRWSNGDTATTINIVVTMDTTFTAYFDSNDDLFSVTAIANYADRGTVTGSGQFNYNEIATLVATPNSGYIFDGWSNGEKNQVIYITVVCDTVVKAIFKPEGTGLDIVNDVECVVFTEGNRIVVNGASEVFICDALGKTIFNGKTEAETVKFDVPAAGIYFVLCNSKKSFKIVIK